MSGFRNPLRPFAAGEARERALLIGAGVTLVWLLLVVLFWLFGPQGGGDASGLQKLLTATGVIAPVVLIWLAVGLARAIARLREEAMELRASLAVMARKDADADLPRAPSIARPQASPPPRPTRAPSGQAENADQPSLELDAPPPLDLDEHELIAAVNFPDGPDDDEAIRALRKALADPELARLIRAAQDVVTLLAGRGIYMDDLYSGGADAAGWRRFAAGERGARVAALALDADDATIAAATTLLRQDEVFRDVAHHFLRRFDRLIARAAPELDDGLLLALSYTRSGRAFTLLAQVTGMIGEPRREAPPDA